MDVDEQNEKINHVQWVLPCVGKKFLNDNPDMNKK